MRNYDFLFLLFPAFSSVAVRFFAPDHWSQFHKFLTELGAAGLWVLFLGIYWITTGNNLLETGYKIVLCPWLPKATMCQPADATRATQNGPFDFRSWVEESLPAHIPQSSPAQKQPLPTPDLDSNRLPIAREAAEALKAKRLAEEKRRVAEADRKATEEQEQRIRQEALAFENRKKAEASAAETKRDAEAKANPRRLTVADDLDHWNTPYSEAAFHDVYSSWFASLPFTMENLQRLTTDSVGYGKWISNIHVKYHYIYEIRADEVSAWGQSQCAASCKAIDRCVVASHFRASAGPWYCRLFSAYPKLGAEWIYAGKTTTDVEDSYVWVKP